MTVALGREHGRHGADPLEPEDRRLVSAVELEQLEQAVLGRLRQYADSGRLAVVAGSARAARGLAGVGRRRLPALGRVGRSSATTRWRGSSRRSSSASAATAARHAARTAACASTRRRCGRTSPRRRSSTGSGGWRATTRSASEVTVALDQFVLEYELRQEGAAELDEDYRRVVMAGRRFTTCARTRSTTCGTTRSRRRSRSSRATTSSCTSATRATSRSRRSPAPTRSRRSTSRT